MISTNAPDAHRPLRVLYDAQIFQQQRYGGISRYYADLFRHLVPNREVEIRLAMRHSLNAYLPEVPGLEMRNVLRTRQQEDFLPGIAFPGKPFWFRQYRSWWNRRHGNDLALREAFSQGGFDIFHPTYYGSLTELSLCDKPMVVTVYDMIHELFADLLPEENTSSLKRQAVDRADHVIAISQSTKNDLIRLWGIPEAKISVVHLGSRFESHPLAGERCLPPGRHILYVGERHLYKNFPLFLKAVEPLLQEFQDLYLALVGRPFSTSEERLVAELGLGSKIRVLANDDRLLPSYYRDATAFVFPSRYEGFGIPVLEAMHCNCPMALSNTSSLPEIAGDAAVYFDPDSPVSMRSAVRRLIEDTRLQNELRAHGRRRVARFRLDQTAKETLEVYRHALENA